jgi:GWxTD domain-containing protein
MPSSIDSASILGDRGSLVTILPTELALKALHNKMIECTSPIVDGGEGDYVRAEELFREAIRATPNNPRVFRHLAMLLAEKSRWHELEAVAHERTLLVPTDPWAWLTLGLAMQRSGLSSLAVSAFDTGSARLEPRERGRMFEFSRLLSDRDSAAFARSALPARDTTERTFWAMAAPLWSRKGNDPRTEFLARVTFAELRWTVDELGVRGADSDRGAMHIRYGPPDVISMLRGNDFPATAPHQDDPLPPGTPHVSPGKDLMPDLSDVVTFWDYDNGLSLVFWGSPTYGTAHFPVTDIAHVERIVEIRPVSFDNVATGRIEEIPLGTARFRASGDSVDVLFMSKAPVANIRSATAANNPVRENVWLFGRDVPNTYRDTVMLGASGVKTWRYRVPQSTYMFRIEASAEGALVAGKAMTWITAARDTTTGFSTRGFGISDILLATRAESRGTPARWDDFSIAPVLGSVPRQSSVDFIWENYELGRRGPQAQYHVTLTIQREHSAAGKIAASIIGAVAGAVNIERRDDRIIQRFDRAVPYSATLVDHLTVALGDTPTGTYRVTLEVSDAVSGRKTSRTAELTVSEK